MRFVIYGAGAIGGLVGGRLHESGHDVVLIARGEHRRVMAERGLRIESNGGDAVVPVHVVGEPAQLDLGPDDVVILAMKTQHTLSALEALADVAPPETPIVCMQNGVESERLALRRFANVYGITVMCPATFLDPGVVEASSWPVTGLLDIGRYPSGADETAEAISAALNRSTFESLVQPEIMRWKYAKLLMNLGNAAEALCGAEARFSELARRARSEGAACFRAAGIDAASREEEADRRLDRLTIEPVHGRERGGGSSWQSIQRGTGNIEADYLNGEVVLLGRLHGVATPVNELLQRLANELAADGGPPGQLDADELLDLASP